jgi:hypothetical protein
MNYPSTPINKLPFICSLILVIWEITYFNTNTTGILRIGCICVGIIVLIGIFLIVFIQARRDLFLKKLIERAMTEGGAIHCIRFSESLFEVWYDNPSFGIKIIERYFDEMKQISGLIVVEEKNNH